MGGKRDSPSARGVGRVSIEPQVGSAGVGVAMGIFCVGGGERVAVGVEEGAQATRERSNIKKSVLRRTCCVISFFIVNLTKFRALPSP